MGGIEERGLRQVCRSNRDLIGLPSCYASSDDFCILDPMNRDTSYNAMRIAKKYGVLLLLTALSNCGGRFSEKDQQLSQVIEFVHSLRTNNGKAIYEQAYHANSIENITDSNSRKFEVGKAFKLIQKYGLPPTDKWLYTYNPNTKFDRHQFRIPLFDGLDSTSKLLHAAILISFPPKEISKKIYSYEIETEYRPSIIKSISN